MWLKDLEQALRAELPEPALVGRRVSRCCQLAQWGELTVQLRVARDGDLRFTYTLAGLSLERAALLMLICTEAHCAQAQAVKARWAERQQATPMAGAGPLQSAARKAAVPAGLGFRPLQVQPLMQEAHFEVAGHHCTARPATWPCLRHCPVQAHEPVTVNLPGWDLFENGVWLAGGVVDAAAEGGCGQRPRFQTLQDAQDWMRSQQHSAQAALAAIR